MTVAKSIVDMQNVVEEDSESLKDDDMGFAVQGESEDANDKWRKAALDKLEKASEDTILGQSCHKYENLNKVYLGLENSTVNIAKSIQQGGTPSVGSVAPSLIEADSNDLMHQAQIFLYANGNTQPPTAINLDKSLLRDLLFYQSPAKDVALASVSMRSIPFAPVLEKLSLSEMKYGSVRRFYIETPIDNAISITVQESMINKSPPK